MSSSTISIGSNPGNEISDRQKSVTLLRAVGGGKNGEKSSDEEPEDLNEIIANAEAIARQDPKAVIGRKKNSRPVLNKREYAQALHRQADNLHLKYFDFSSFTLNLKQFQITFNQKQELNEENCC